MEESSERGSGARSMRDQCVEGWRVRRAYFGRWRWRWLIVLGVLALVVTILIPRDRALLAALQIDTEAATSWARRLSDWGQFEVSTLAVAAFFGVGGWLRRRRDWTRVATYALIAGIVGGVLVNVFRPTFGRTRPSSDLPDAFHGPSLDHDFHSFPSGHACSTASTAAAVALAYPPAAVPVGAFSVAVAWSRLEQRKHHLSDVLAGLTLGVFVGWIVVGPRKGSDGSA